MKNLKKAGAVALAAIMAVAFAPVASLPAKAAATQLAVGDTTISSSGNYEVDATEDYSSVDLTVEKNAVLNVKSLADNKAYKSIKVTKGASLTITGEVSYTTAMNGAKTYTSGNAVKKGGTITVGDAGNNNTKNDTESGSLTIKNATIIDAIDVVKGSVYINSGKVTTITAKELPTRTDSKDTDREALAGASSITIDDTADIAATTINIEDTNKTEVIKGQDSLRASSGITINGGSVVLPAGYESGAGTLPVVGDFVTITGGKFTNTNNNTTTKYTAQVTTAGEAASFKSTYLNSVNEKALPVAVVAANLTTSDDNTVFYVGDKAIKAAAEADRTKNVYVINGDASLTGISAGAGFIVNDVTQDLPANTVKGALPTVTVTAADGASLLNIDTKEVPYNTIVEENKYYVGFDQFQAAITALGNSAPNGEFMREVKPTYAADSKDADGSYTKLTAPTRNTAGGGAEAYTTDLTYFTADPTDHFEIGTEIGLVDGKYYIVGAASENAYGNATGSVQILHVNNYNKKTDDVSESDKRATSFMVRHSIASTVTGPADAVTAVYDPEIKTVTLGGTSVDKPTATVWVYGKGLATSPITDGGAGIDGTNVTAADLYINGLADEKLTVNGIDKDTVIKTADGIDWYTDNVNTLATHNEYNYNFAKTEAANKNFKDALLGYTSDKGVKIPASITGAVRVSTGISGEYEGVTTGVNIDAEWAGGEQTSDLAADKASRTWYVNFENKNVPQNVYRLRAKVGNNHLFTMDKDEADNAVASGDWVLENTKAFTMLPWNTTVKGAVKVLRFRNVKTNEFLYTTDPTEQANLFASADWAEGNVAFCGLDPESKEGYPVTRLNSLIGQGHLYSTAKKEVDNAVENDFYKQEGVAFWAVETPEKEK